MRQPARFRAVVVATVVCTVIGVFAGEVAGWAIAGVAISSPVALFVLATESAPQPSEEVKRLIGRP